MTRWQSVDSPLTVHEYRGKVLFSYLGTYRLKSQRFSQQLFSQQLFSELPRLAIVDLGHFHRLSCQLVGFLLSTSLKIFGLLFRCSLWVFFFSKLCCSILRVDKTNQTFKHIIKLSNPHFMNKASASLILGN